MSNYTNCQHDSASSYRAPADPCATAWACDACDHLTPFTEADYAFCNAQPWTPRAPEGVPAIRWAFMSREARFAHYAR